MSLPCPGTRAGCWDRVLHSLFIVQVHPHALRTAQRVKSLSLYSCHRHHPECGQVNYLYCISPRQALKAPGIKKSGWRRAHQQQGLELLTGGKPTRGLTHTAQSLPLQSSNLTQDITLQVGPAHGGVTGDS